MPTLAASNLTNVGIQKQSTKCSSGNKTQSAIS